MERNVTNHQSRHTLKKTEGHAFGAWLGGIAKRLIPILLLTIVPITLCAAESETQQLYAGAPLLPARYPRFRGIMSYAEIPNAPELSVSATGLTIAVWMRPDTLTFPKTEGSLPTEQYVHWLGKGEAQRQEWTFRMYSQTTPPGLRANRISFYVFNPEGARGCGSYFQDPVVAGQWIHVVGVVDAAAQQTAIYKNGEFRHSDSYGNQITPAPGTAPLRLATKDLASFLKGAIGPVHIWSRPLTASEIEKLYASDVVPRQGLVAQYRLNEGSGSVIHDTAHGHDGTLLNAEWAAGRGPIQMATGTSGGGC
jgi:hypothetical protein